MPAGKVADEMGSSIRGVELSFQLGNTLLEGPDDPLDILSRIAGRDRLGAIPIEGNHLDKEQPLNLFAHLRLSKLGDKLGMLSDIFQPGMADYFQAGALRIIHQKEHDAIRSGDVARGNELPVAFVVGKADAGWT